MGRTQGRQLLTALSLLVRGFPPGGHAHWGVSSPLPTCLLALTG